MSVSSEPGPNSWGKCGSGRSPVKVVAKFHQFSRQNPAQKLTLHFLACYLGHNEKMKLKIKLSTLVHSLELASFSDVCVTYLPI